MHEIEYLLYLTAEGTDRLRVTARKDRGDILEFIVQYETVILGEWRPVVRYDTAHGFAHKDMIRADGEVASRDMSKGPWENDLSDLRIYPGDTIVIPEKLPKQFSLYGVLNWSQMFSQFALGAAALNVIR